MRKLKLPSHIMMKKVDRKLKTDVFFFRMTIFDFKEKEDNVPYTDIGIERGCNRFVMGKMIDQDQVYGIYSLESMNFTCTTNKL